MLAFIVLLAFIGIGCLMACKAVIETAYFKRSHDEQFTDLESQSTFLSAPDD